MTEENGIDKWYIERHGRFTASEIYKLLTKGNSGGSMFGAGATSYIRQKAIESMTVLWERPELENVKSLLHGRVHEYPAYEAYRRYTGNYDMRYFGSDAPLFLNYCNDSGGSPDGIMGQGDNVVLGLEIKCPKNPSVHFDYLNFKHQYDIQEYNEQYYAQIQFLLMITKAKEWHFCSYDDRFKNQKLKLKVIEVLPDNKFQNNLEIRLQMAIKERNKIIQYYQNI